MEKIINDRLNRLKSVLAEETKVKLTKTLNEEKINELKIRINELTIIKIKYETSIERRTDN